MSPHIRFTVIDCDGCGARRSLTLPCPECGKKPRKDAVDPHVVRRRERVRQIDRASLHFPDKDAGVEGSLLTSWHAVLAGMEFLEKAKPTEWEEDHLPQFATALCSLKTSENRLAPAASLRPTLVPKAQLAATKALLKAWEHLKEALTTENMGDAQTLAYEAQELTNAAVDLINGVEEIETEAAQLTDRTRESNLVRRLVIALLNRYETNDILAAISSAVSEAHDVLDFPIPEDHAAQFVWLSTIAKAHFDYDSFRATAATFLGAFSESDVTVLDQVPTLVEDLEGAGGRLIEAVTAFEATTARGTTDTTVIHRLIRFYMELYEDVGGVLFAAARCILTPKDSGEWCCQIADYKFSTNLKWLSKRHQILVGNKHSNLRNAGGHGRSHRPSQDGQAIVFHLSSLKHLPVEERTMTFAELVDATLELLETLLALQWALLTAASTQNYRITADRESNAQSGFKDEDFAQISIEDATKQYPATVTHENGHWKVIGKIPAFDMLWLAHSTIAAFPDQIESIELGVETPASIAEISFSSLSAALTKPGATSAEKQQARVALLSGLTIQGQVALTESELILWAALAATDGDLSLTEKVRTLRDVGALGNSHGLTRSADTARALIRTLTRDLPIDQKQIKAEASTAAGELDLEFDSLHAIS